MNIETVTVALGERAYPIHIGADLYETIGQHLGSLLERPRLVIVTDTNVAAAQGERLQAGLKKAGIDYQMITLNPGEATKSFGEFQKLVEQLLELGVERQDLIAAFGGGVIGDITGFASAVLRRGCRFAQIPTTLLAQVDSAVGGKTAINTRHGKNLVGAFHQPSIVLSDLTSLETLSPRELRAGYAEVLKYGLISDPAFFAWLEENADALLAGGVTERQKAVKTSCQAKAQIVADDEREGGKRALLNLGHTFGHALEAALGYSDKLLHGEGVAIGMALAYEYSALQGMCEEEDAQRVKAHLRQVGLPSEIADLKTAFDAEELMALMMQDKKVRSNLLTLILADAIGSAKIVNNAAKADVLAFLKTKTAR